MVTRCHGCSDRLTLWTFAFHLVANANFRVCTISLYLANAWITQIKLKIEPSFTQCIRAISACPQTPIVSPRPYHMGNVTHRKTTEVLHFKRWLMMIVTDCPDL